jgi:hypothetical protein
MEKQRQVWQLAGNPDARPHLDTFLRHGVALIGPGDPGPWKADRPDSHFADELSVMVTDGIRCRLYDGRRDFAPVAYANLIRLKASASELFNRIRRV